MARSTLSKIGCRNYDKDQQHRGHCQQDDEGSKFLHVDMVNCFVGHGSFPSWMNQRRLSQIVNLQEVEGK